MISFLCLSMISAQTRSAFVARENRYPLFRIMLSPQRNDVRPSIDAAAIWPDRMQPPRKVPSQRAQPVHAAATEAGRFPHRIEPRDRLSFRVEHPALKVGHDAAEALAADDEFTNRDQRQCLWIIDRLKFAEADAIAAIFSQCCNAAQLLVVHQAFATAMVSS